MLIRPDVPAARMGPRAGPVAVSLALHAAVLGCVVTGSAPVRERPYSVYRERIFPNRDKLVWYSFRSRLPEISPLERQGRSRPPRVDVKTPEQTIASSVPGAIRAPQMIWQPAPQLRVEQDLRSPNLLAFETPRIAPPPKPKLFVPPAPAPRPAEPAPALPPAPQLAARADTAVKLIPQPQAAIARPDPKRFVPPPERPRAAPGVPLISAAPQLSASTAVPKLALPEPGEDLEARLRAARPEAKRFVPPPARTGPASAPVLDDAPYVPGSGLSAAVVGLQPAPTLEQPFPEGSREATFAGGPERNPDGGGPEPVPGARIFVPGLMVRGARPGDSPDAQPILMARANPTSPENLRASQRFAVRGTESAQPGVTRVSSSPDPRMAGRAIYSLTVQMPNITSYIGSWILWFAERGESMRALSDIQSPVPLRKVDPKYIPAAVADHVEGKVVLTAVIRRDGHVDSIALLKGLDERLDSSASDAFAKWVFEPAMRAGAPVEVDAVVEIPFRLAPLKTK